MISSVNGSQQSAIASSVNVRTSSPVVIVKNNIMRYQLGRLCLEEVLYFWREVG